MMLIRSLHNRAPVESLRRMRTWCANFAVSVATILAFAQAAEAGTMIVYSCHTPTGRAVGTGGWSAYNPAAKEHGLRNDCAAGPSGTLLAEIGREGITHPATYLGWKLTAAPGSIVAHWQAYVCARPFGWGSTFYLDWIDENGQTGYETVSWNSSPPRVGCATAPPYWQSNANLIGAGPVRQVRFSAACPVGSCPEVDGVVSRAEIAAFRAEVRDDTAPVVVSSSGTLLEGGPHTGQERVVFDATDVGVGLHRAVAEIRVDRVGEWSEVGTWMPAEETCRPIRETAYRYEFSAAQPCPLDAQSAELTVDTATLPVGTHGLRLTLEDAAGNLTTISPARTFEVQRPAATARGPQSVTPSIASSGRAHLNLAGASTRRVRRSGPVWVSGRVRDMVGNPIPRAVVTLYSRTYLPKARKTTGDWTPAGTVTANEAGVFRARVTRGPSRALLLSYRFNPGDPMPAATTVTNLVMPARVTARPARSRVRNGGLMTVGGRVAGPIPSGGVLVRLEANDGRRWVPVATTRRSVRTAPTGAYRLSYRFRSTFEPITYRFRVVVDEDSDFPYSRGSSSPVAVRVSP
jgi:hypothetical protein